MARPVLILGAGINGAALARELVLNRIPVVVVDTHDIASGTTAYSSRLIHGGLRYLEYGEFDLVRESLDERSRLLTLAGDFVRPLKFFVPVERRAAGLITAARRFFGSSAKYKKSRGLWLIRAGLWLYDRFAKSSNLPKRSSCRLPNDHAPKMNPTFRWACSYYDAQIRFPERLVVAMLNDARQLADKAGVEFQVLPYHRATLDGETVSIRRVLDDNVTPEFQPKAIVNATGAWVDQTLERLAIDSKRLIGGTKGSHLVTHHRGLQDQLAGNALYLEASDGRPIFVLPFGESTLIGTTDLAFEGDPQKAVATDEEIEYLIANVNRVFPSLDLARDDIALHYCGVRPLPYTDASTPGSITRRHLLHEHGDTPLPIFSIVGGKLTTARSLAEETTATIAERLGIEVIANSRDREISESSWFSPDQIISDDDVRRIIRNEWVTRLEDLVERRLMLLYKEPLNLDRLNSLATMLVAEQKIADGAVDEEVQSVASRLESHFGVKLMQ